MPTEDYLLKLTWLFDKNKPQFITNIYFVFEENHCKNQ